MSWSEEIKEIARRREFAMQLGGPEAVARQHANGRQTVRERIDKLADPGSFNEFGILSGKASYDENKKLKSVRPANAVIGTALINGRKVSIGGDDYTIRGGSSEATISEKWIYAENYALEMRMPLVRVVESAGGSVRLLEQQGSTKIPGYPTWKMAGMLGYIPIAAMAMGPCAGLGALKAACAHFSVMVKGTSQVFAGGPPVVERAMGKPVDKEALGGSRIHTRESGVINNEAATEEDAIEQVKRFLSYMPSSVYEMPPVVECDDPKDRREEELLSIIPRERRKIYKSRRILELVMDKGSVFEIAPLYGRSVVTCLARMGGRPVGVIANDPMHYGGGLTRAAAEKMESFIDICDTFHLPIINFVDQPGTIVGPDAERMGTVKGSVRVVSAIEQSTVPWCAVVIRRLYGLAGSAYGRLQDINLHFAWPSARWGSIPISGGVEAAFRAELADLPPEERKVRLAEIEQHFDHLESPFLTAERFRVPDIIDPRETRTILNNWLDDAWRVLPEQLGVRARTIRL
ncbi:acyl-CoA carboxylase subunit beta [Oceanibacterium hippocampi]|uniref:Putative propionyl-CoA carboxylase beta chain 5 n=1 Tax=Oceanibacterium hippocampi TaxID=745714 RepID=A0A1Y5SS88_9PROT|nr:carboxyl transferase domain-containing protein [Oceanibacterium hippocampi]SLN47311.1 putative propionyl-CoA carboxylase beta chain 5 [Oceanibacterium hippocampi]